MRESRIALRSIRATLASIVARDLRKILLLWNVSLVDQREIVGDVVFEELFEFRDGHRQLLDADLRQPLLGGGTGETLLPRNGEKAEQIVDVLRWRS